MSGSSRQPLWRVILLTLFLSSVVQGAEYFQPKKGSDLPPGTIQEKAYRIKGARVSYVNEEAVRRNFPQTAKMTRDQMDQWILNNFAYMAEGQEKLFGIRVTPFELDKNDAKILYRPKDSNRAGMLEAEGGGLADGKGNGHINNEKLDVQAARGRKIFQSGDAGAIDAFLDMDHSDGVVTAGEANHETAQQVRAQIKSNEWNLAHPDQPRRETVETLFNIDVPGYVMRSHGNKDRLSIYFREPQFARERAALESSEFIVNPAPKRFSKDGNISLMNWLQTTPSGAVVDYGATINTDELAVERHKYRAPKLDGHGNPVLDERGNRILTILGRDELLNRLKSGEYIDSHDSLLRLYSFETANGMDRCRENWEVCRSYFENFLKDMTLPTKDSKPTPAAPLNAGDRKLVRLFEAAQKNQFGPNDTKELADLILEVNKDFLGPKALSATDEGVALRLRHTKVELIVTQLKPEAANALLKELSTKTMIKTDPLLQFLDNCGKLSKLDTQGLGDTILPSKVSLYDAMIDYKTSKGATPYLGLGYFEHLNDLTHGGMVLEDPNRMKRVVEALGAKDAKIQSMAKELLLPGNDISAKLMQSKPLLDGLAGIILNGGKGRSLTLKILMEHAGTSVRLSPSLLKALLAAHADKESTQQVEFILKSSFSIDQKQIEILTKNYANNQLKDEDLDQLIHKGTANCIIDSIKKVL